MSRRSLGSVVGQAAADSRSILIILSYSMCATINTAALALQVSAVCAQLHHL
jgi:hypothetical protein